MFRIVSLNSGLYLQWLILIAFINLIAMSVSKEIFAMARVPDNAPPGNLVIEGAARPALSMLIALTGGASVGVRER